MSASRLVEMLLTSDFYECNREDEASTLEKGPSRSKSLPSQKEGVPSIDLGMSGVEAGWELQIQVEEGDPGHEVRIQGRV